MLDAELVKAEDPDSQRLMLVLHGLGDSMEGYRWFPQMMRLPWLNYLLVNAPDLYFGGYSWYDFSGDPDSGVRRSRVLLTELLDHWLGKEGYQAAQTMLFGFSQGCLIALDVGLRYPQRLAGVIGVSGYVHRPEELMSAINPETKQLPLLITHGTMDPLIPFDQVRKQFQELKTQGLNIEWHEFVKVHTIEGEAELAIMRNFAQKCLNPS